LTIRGWHLLLLVTVGAVVYATIQRNARIDERIDHANRLADMDTLRMIAGEEREFWASRTFVLTEELRETFIEKIALGREVDRMGFRLRSLASVEVGASGQIEDEATVSVESDSGATRLAVDWSDSLLVLHGFLRFPGVIQPDPTPPTEVRLDYTIQLAIEIAQVCDEDDLPQTLVSSPDPRVRVRAVRSIVDRAVSCIGERTGILSLNPWPRIEPATGIVFGLGALMGWLAGK